MFFTIKYLLEMTLNTNLQFTDFTLIPYDIIFFSSHISCLMFHLRLFTDAIVPSVNTFLKNDLWQSVVYCSYCLVRMGIKGTVVIFWEKINIKHFHTINIQIIYIYITLSLDLRYLFLLLEGHLPAELSSSSN